MAAPGESWPPPGRGWGMRQKATPWGAASEWGQERSPEGGESTGRERQSDGRSGTERSSSPLHWAARRSLDVLQGAFCFIVDGAMIVLALVLSEDTAKRVERRNVKSEIDLQMVWETNTCVYMHTYTYIKCIHVYAHTKCVYVYMYAYCIYTHKYKCTQIHKYIYLNGEANVATCSQPVGDSGQRAGGVPCHSLVAPSLTLR